jgi:pimeloyl-ACP methyl ester carboxylesterase
VKVRDAIVRYLREPTANERQIVFDTIESAEGARIEQVARLIAKMKPQWHEPELAATPDGFLEMTAPGQTTDGDFTYLVQLPPEYDPYRLYPTLVVLNGAYNSPLQELEFWAGSRPPAANGAPGIRRGQAMRRGYITVSIDWHKEHQYEYEFSAREHVAVLTCLRDASRRLSIDADRVFLSGHDIGGEAAWDIAQAHPDLWAGAIPFGPRGEDDAKYISFYHENAEYVSLYFVAGELDGRTINANAPVWNKYLRSTLSKPFDTTLVKFIGRGHEPFHDEILKIFEWMALKQRQGPPANFDCSTLRPWDNFFWWLECDEFPSRYMVHPSDWASGKITPAHVQGRIQSPNNLAAKTIAERATIWLGPDFVNFAEPIKLSFNGRTLSLADDVRPSLTVLLEDVRTRGDRQRPFWAKVEVK